MKVVQKMFQAVLKPEQKNSDGNYEFTFDGGVKEIPNQVFRFSADSITDANLKITPSQVMGGEAIEINPVVYNVD